MSIQWDVNYNVDGAQTPNEFEDTGYSDADPIHKKVLRFLDNKSIFEPKIKNNFFVVFDRIPYLINFGEDGTVHFGDYQGTDNRIVEHFLFSVQTAKKPEIGVEIKEIDDFNMKRRFATGNVTKQEFSLDFINYITTNHMISAHTILYAWMQVGYNVVNGSIGYKNQYSTDMYLYHLGPQKTVVEAWKYENVFPTNIPMPDLKYDGAEIHKFAPAFSTDRILKLSDNALSYGPVNLYNQYVETIDANGRYHAEIDINDLGYGSTTPGA